MHMFYLPSKDDIRTPETNPKVTGGEWARAGEDQARRRRRTSQSPGAVPGGSALSQRHRERLPV
jgi:hypothetical protein